MIFMTPIVRVIKKVSENKKNVDNHIRFFYVKNLKNYIDYINNHKIQCTCI